MPKDAEFEEKEFEIPLYFELAYGSQNVWTPGQVFEHHFGIDAAVYTSNSLFWTLCGYPVPLEGACLPDFTWGFVWRGIGDTRPLPKFKTNLLLQVKRPQYMVRRTPELISRSIGNPYWRFETRFHQQRALERVARNLGNRALVSYACPAFHSLETLYERSQNQRLIESSSFVKAERLRGHTHWVFDGPGTRGVGCSDPEEISDESFLDQIGMLAEERHNEEREDPLELLDDLQQGILAACKEEAELHNRVAIQMLRHYDKFHEFHQNANIDDRAIRAITAFGLVQLFCYSFQVRWHVLA